MVTRQSPITVLQGVGAAKAAAYERLGIRTLGDLLLHYPRAYENRGDIRPLAQTHPDGKSAVLLTVASEPRTVRLRSRKSFLKLRAFDESGSCEIVYFNQDYLKSKFPVGSVYRFYGKVERVGKGYRMSAPAAEAWATGIPLPPYRAVYRMTDGLSQNQIAKDAEAALELLAADGEDPLPAEIRERRSLCTLSYALRNIHKPEDRASLLIARRRLIYDEFFTFSLGTSMAGRRTRSASAPACTRQEIAPLTDQLPYTLTGAQMRAIDEIRRDMAQELPMSRILVGDVGCGKTVCAAAAMLIALQNGLQAALMAPTEILARQHYEDLAPLFERMGYSCALLVGATPAAEKRRIKASLCEKDPARRLPLVIGTHALLTEDVSFAFAGLVVTDEQHRFGARQRATLLEKSEHAHLLVMSATPIPRSLALVLYGDLAISRIDEMPPGRQRVDTFAVDESYRERLNGFIERQVGEGGQVYVVCPAVEEEKDAGEVDLYDLLEEDAPVRGRAPMKSAVGHAEALRERFPGLRVESLHGRMKSREKEDVMQRFAAGQIDILVSTTVIEVGVNVPNACLMIVENAERFGLSQLHQLRGRVGRGKRKSWCILVAGDGVGQSEENPSRKRLDVMRTTYDGFAIAEQDLEQRGPGDFLGSAADGTLRQSGGLSFRLADVAEDGEILSRAAQDAKALLREDPELQAHPVLAERVREAFTIEEGLIS
ncbi:MAG: ATP-dependent DNA helicase RecG [Clostridia bacterium]|nr:ATP-dependent DNA helicase RecG [Clostridia bacterium]